MKVLKTISIVLFSLAFLAACSNANDSKSNTENSEKMAKENKEKSSQSVESNTNNDDIDKVIEKSKEVESYHTSLDLGANLDNEQDEELNAEVDYINGDPPELSLTSFGILRTIAKDGKTYYYNDEEWIDITDSVDSNTLYNVTYQEVINTLKILSDELTVEEKDGEKVFRYEGNNQNVYKALENLINVNFGTVDVSNHETTLEFVVDQKEQLVESIHFNTEINDDEGNVSLEGQSVFSDFNNIDDIELPEDIVEE